MKDEEIASLKQELSRQENSGDKESELQKVRDDTIIYRVITFEEGFVKKNSVCHRPWKIDNPIDCENVTSKVISDMFRGLKYAKNSERYHPPLLSIFRVKMRLFSHNTRTTKHFTDYF